MVADEIDRLFDKLTEDAASIEIGKLFRGKVHRRLFISW